MADAQSDPADRLAEYADPLARGGTPAKPAAQFIRESLQGVGADAPNAGNRPAVASGLAMR